MKYKIIIPEEESQRGFNIIGPGKEEPKQDPLNLEKLESKLDNALSKETTESLTDWLNSKRDKQEPNFYEKLKEYFENTPREKVLEDWNKSAHLDNIGPTVDEFIENSAEERLKDAANVIYPNDGYEDEMYCDLGEYQRDFFIKGIKSDIARDYWYEKFKLEQNEK